jgi:CHAD domain-containing protein
VLPPLDGLPHVATVSAPTAATITTEYYDTDDLRLLRAGIKLQRLARGPDEGWRLRFPSGPKEISPVTQRELRAPPGGSGDPVPVELARLVRAYTRGTPLRPVARIETRRNQTTLLDAAGTPLAEILADEVAAQTLGQSTTLTRWNEIEVDLTGGSKRLLRAADEQLRRGGLQPADRYGKLERALGGEFPGQPAQPAQHAQHAQHAQPARPARPARHATAGAVVVAYAADQVARITALDPAVRMDEPDSIHQLRVATRRLRSTFQSFPQVLSTRETRHIRDELKWLGGVLGEARDAGVLGEYLETGLAGLPAELSMGPAQARLRAYFAPLQASTRAAVSDALDSPRYFTLLDDLDRLLTDPPLTLAAAAPAARLLPRAIAQAYRRTRRRMRRALRAPAGPTRDVALHEARKAAKRTRYAAEAARPLCGKDGKDGRDDRDGKDARRFAQRMKAVQEVLGDHQDAVNARATAREIGVRANLAGESSFTFGILHERAHRDALDSEGPAWHAWQRAAHSKARKRL